MYDVIVIGAGLLGCFSARALAQYDLNVLVLEAEGDVCSGISKANTGIIYSGVDNKPGTLKARLAVESCRDYEQLAEELDVPFRRTGSLMLSFGKEADDVLKWKLERGKENKVLDLKLLSAEEVLELEPEVSEEVSSGLFVPSTGTVNPWEVCIAAYENAKANGAGFRFHERVMHISRASSGFSVETEKAAYSAKVIINCAGLSSDAVREMVQTPLIRLFPTGADYLVLDTTVGERIRHILFHETEKKEKGVTLVPTVNGNLLIGPTEREALPDMATDSAGIEELIALCGRVVPHLPMDVIRTFGSERPNPFYVRRAEESGAGENVLSMPREELWVPEKKSISNFTILEEEGLFSFIGIKTPGLTCAEALGRLIAEKTTDYLGCDRKNPDYDPTRKGIPSPAGLSMEERAELIKEDSDYGEIICRCRGISKAEVLEAIRRGAKTIEEVKFRAGTGMGRCQGGFCTEKIRAILESYPGVKNQTKEPSPCLDSRCARDTTTCLEYDIVIIGGGAAGIAAAIEAAKEPDLRVLLIDRDHGLGGILQQCVHNGFGLSRYSEDLTGLEYARKELDQLKELPIDIKTETTVLKITKEKEIFAVSASEGMIQIRAGAIILAMGCRERTAGQLLLAGTRPEGVLTAGRLQYIINIEERIPGQTAVIVGSGDVGLIMARQMAQAGICVVGVYEKEKDPGGLPKNLEECLNAYDIPLYLRKTVKEIHGKDRLTGVTVAEVDQEGGFIEGTEQKIDCNLLVIAAGLIPENELTREAGIAIDLETGGPAMDKNGMTGCEGIFAAGNVRKVMRIVDAVSESGKAAARSAMAYLRE